MVGERPMIDYAFAAAARAGCQSGLLALAPGKERLLSHAHEVWSISIAAFYQSSPRGTGHLLTEAVEWIARWPVFYVMPDTIFTGLTPIMIDEARGQHDRLGTAAHLFLWPTNESTQMGCFEVDNGLVVRHCEKRVPDWSPRDDGTYLAWGAAILWPDFFETALDALHSPPYSTQSAHREFTIDDVYDAALASGCRLGASVADGVYVDCGTPEGIKRAERFLSQGVDVVQDPH